MAVTPKESPADAGQFTATGSGNATDLARQVQVLKDELARLRSEIERSARRSASAARNVASEGVEALKATGGEAYERLRHGASDLEQEVAKHIREKPMTSLAIAAGIGFILAQMLRR
jgi:ElaB/YqjD/DUF883 family membrane-anchored ribosome-binding protein